MKYHLPHLSCLREINWGWKIQFFTELSNQIKGFLLASTMWNLSFWRCMFSIILFCKTQQRYFGLNLIAYLHFKTIFCSKVALDVWLMNFFYLKKKCFTLKIFRFFCFCEIHRFQNLWHHKHCYIMEVTIMLISFES